MATNICTRVTIALVFTIVSVKISTCTYIEHIPGLAGADDPNACFWFAIYNGPSIFRCCDGYFKINAANLTEKCIECPSGSYGFFCQNNCTCINGGTCDPVEGFCNCPAGYFGNNCQFTCNCQNGATCMQDGSCVCVDGFYGKLCQRNCSCPKNSVCNGETGKCMCQDGFYGNLCLSCKCSNTEQCDPFTGACSCKPGYYGEKCDKQCPCFNGAYCSNDEAKNCICSSGWVGSQCTDCDTGIVKANGLPFCEDKCLHCYNGDRCSVEKGNCLCSPGWQGNRCDKKCESGFYGNNCSEICLCLNGMCDHVTGICQCKSGWTGEYCEKPCPDNCVMCEDYLCISCKPGWTGERCGIRCKPGFHGDRCQETCAACNCSTSCHHVNGNCPDIIGSGEHKSKYPNARACIENPFKLECHDGWTGGLCNVTTSKATTKGMFFSALSQSETCESDDTTVRPTEDGLIANANYHFHTWIVYVAVVVSIFVACLVIIIIVQRKARLKFSIFRKNQTHGKDGCSDLEKETAKPKSKFEPCTSPESVPVTDIIGECDSFIANDVKGTESKAVHIYATVDKQKKKTQRRNVIKESSHSTKPAENDALIQTKATISTYKDVIQARSCKGPYEIVSLDTINSNANPNEIDKNYDLLHQICQKQDINNNTDIGEYELLNHPR